MIQRRNVATASVILRLSKSRSRRQNCRTRRSPFSPNRTSLSDAPIASTKPEVEIRPDQPDLTIERCAAISWAN
jgi:hypothetical protein